MCIKLCMLTTPKLALASISVADLGGVPRVPEPPLVELDIGQAGRGLRRCACILRKQCTHALVTCITTSCIELAVVVDSSSAGRQSFRFLDLHETPSPSQIDTAAAASAASERGECYLS